MPFRYYQYLFIFKANLFIYTPRKSYKLQLKEIESYNKMGANIPIEIVNKIMLYVSHPVADIVADALDRFSTGLIYREPGFSYGELNRLNNIIEEKIQEILVKRLQGQFEIFECPPEQKWWSSIFYTGCFRREYIIEYKDD